MRWQYSWPFLILFFCRIASYHEARNRMREITTQSVGAKFLKEKRALKTTSFVIGVALLCYLPMTLFRIFQGALISSPDTFLAVESLILTFALSNSVVNPVIYCARSTQYQETFVQNKPCTTHLSSIDTNVITTN